MTKQKDFFVLVNKCLYREVNLTKHNAIEKPSGGNSTQVDNRTGVLSGCRSLICSNCICQSSVSLGFDIQQTKEKKKAHAVEFITVIKIWVEIQVL